MGRLRLRRLRPDERYWNHQEFRAWVEVEFKGRNRAFQARALGLHRQHLDFLMEGKCSPTFETYSRLLVQTGMPPGTWNRGVSEEE